jgi:tetratricopeptide (TPR) repeat protein
MTHYDDEILLQYAEGSSPIGGEIASHLVDCTKCNVTIDEQRDLIEILRGAAVWEHVPETSTPAEASCVRELAAFQERIAAEDADADAILDDVLSGPPSWWRTRLTKSATHLTGGLVRQILARADGLHATAPLRAYDMTRLAVDIADELPVSAYASDFVITLRGHALREHAYVLMCLGRYREAVEFCDAAERAFAQMPIADYELARVWLVRALAYQSTDRLEDAASLARSSGATFRRFGDTGRYVIACMTEGSILQLMGRKREALDIWIALHELPDLDAASRVSVTHDLGICYRELGEAEKAIHFISAAVAEFELLGETVNAAKARWSVAATLVSVGRAIDAVPILRTTWKEFENLGMEADAALVGLELAEALLLSGQAGDVPAICRSVLDRFTRAGMTSRAINALAFLREAVALGQAQPSLVRHVHDFLRMLPPESSRISTAARRLDD